MKSFTFIFASLFFLNITSAQVVPTPCSSCKYGYEKKGTRTLVGAKRNYYGSVKTTTKSGFSSTPNGNDRKLKLQDVFPGMDSLGLFYNYDPNGTAHMTELDGNVEVFKRNDRVYAWACENLLEIVEKPAPVVKREKVTLTVYDTIYQPVVVKPMTVRLQLCTASYINGSHQQTFYHNTQEFTLETLPYDGEYIRGKKFLTEIPKTLDCGSGLFYSDYFWVTAH